MGRQVVSARLRPLAALAVAATMVLATPPASGSDRFGDVPTDDVFHDDIAWLAEVEVTRGCNPPDNTRFCPDDPVTRGQMAAFLVRALDLPAGSAAFTDTTGSVFAADIASLADAGITRGCNPPDNSRFCPDDLVTRGQMAAFLVRALDLASGTASFSDVPSGHTFAADIAAMADAGITRGCNPPDNSRFCPDDPVTRGQMAAFLRRGLEGQIEVVTYLSNLDEVDRDVFALRTGPVAIDGDVYEQSVYWQMRETDDPEWVEYNLGREYSSLCALTGVADDSQAATAFQVEVFGDGASLGTYDIALGDPAPISVSVEGVLRLRIESRPGTTADFAGDVAWGNAYLSNQEGCETPIPDPSPDPVPQTYLSNMDEVDRDVFSLRTGVVDVDAETYTRSVYWQLRETDDPEWVEYDMSRDFRRLCGVVGVTDDDSDASTAFEVEVYVDGSSVYSADVSLGSPADIDVAVTEGLRLRIEARPATTEDFAGNVAWADTYLATAGYCS